MSRGMTGWGRQGFAAMADWRLRVMANALFVEGVEWGAARKMSDWTDEDAGRTGIALAREEAGKRHAGPVATWRNPLPKWEVPTPLPMQYEGVFRVTAAVGELLEEFAGEPALLYRLAARLTLAAAEIEREAARAAEEGKEPEDERDRTEDR